MIKLDWNGPEKRPHVLAAVSGGADSVALILLLRELAERGGISLTAAHFEHGIRGEESRRDAAFVEGFCRERGIPFVTERADVPAYAEAHGLGTTGLLLGVHGSCPQQDHGSECNYAFDVH